MNTLQIPVNPELEMWKKRTVDLMQLSKSLLNNWDSGYCFRSDFIGISDPVVLKNWKKVKRGYPEEEQVKDWIDMVRSHSMVFYDGLQSLAEQVRYCEANAIPGAYVETGCCRGGSAAIMAKACLTFGKSPRAIHLFDSFEGLPHPDARHDTDEWLATEWRIPTELHDGEMVATGALKANEADVIEIFKRIDYPLDKLTLHKGWFCDTAPIAAPNIGPIAILRLDGDLYESTLVVLKNLYEQVVPGGVVIFDDFGIAGCKKAVTDFFADRAFTPYICRADAMVHYLIKP